MGIPNILSIIRILLVPLFVTVYFSEIQFSNIYAALVYVVAGVTDMLDGLIARKYNLTSKLGKVLDPLADKLITFTVIICITIDKVIPLWAVVVFAVKELLMGLGGLIIHKKIADVPSSNYLGKSSTVIFFLVCTVLMVFRGIPADVANILIAIAIGFTLIAFCGYLTTFSKLIKSGKAE